MRLGIHVDIPTDPQMSEDVLLRRIIAEAVQEIANAVKKSKKITLVCREDKIENGQVPPRIKYDGGIVILSIEEANAMKSLLRSMIYLSTPNMKIQKAMDKL